MATLQVGDRVKFTPAVIKRAANLNKSAIGTVVSVDKNIVMVDWEGTWISHIDGTSVRAAPAANLVRVA